VEVLGRVRPLDVPLTAEAALYATQWVYGDDSKVRNELGLDWRQLGETPRDNIAWLAAAGHIKPWWANRLP
jgi:hypothetical protein